VVLVTLLGNLRGGEKAWHSLEINLLDPSDADLALMIGGTADLNSASLEIQNSAPDLFRRAEGRFWYHQESSTTNIFDDLLEIIRTNSSLPLFPKSPVVSNVTWRDIAINNSRDGTLHVLGGTSADPTGNGVAIPFYKWMLSRTLEATGLIHSYDYFVATRSDYYYDCQVNLQTMFQKGKKYSQNRKEAGSLWIPQGADNHGLCDRFVFLPRKHAVRALQFIEKVVVYPEQYLQFLGNPEALWGLRIRQLRLSVKRFPLRMFSVRAEGDSTRWSQGDRVRHNDSDLIVKYGSEFEAAKQSCYIPRKKRADYVPTKGDHVNNNKSGTHGTGSPSLLTGTVLVALVVCGASLVRFLFRTADQLLPYEAH